MEKLASENLDAKESMLQSVRSMESEIKALNERMNGMVSPTFKKAEQKKIEHFQNQFIVQEKQLDKMKHNIKIYGSNEKGQSELEEYSTYFKGIVDEFEGFASQY